MLRITNSNVIRQKTVIEFGRYLMTLTLFLLSIHNDYLLSAQDKTEAGLSVEQWQDRLDPAALHLASHLEELQRQPEIIKRVIPELAIILVRGNESAQKLSVRCLENAGAVPESTLDLLISLLDHPDYTFRIEVAHTLRKLGKSGIPKLQAALESNSPRIRSNALSILNHLIIVDASTLEKLHCDSDERVRVCVARGWLKHGKLGIAKIGELTMDEAPTVAVAAVRALQYNYTDPETAVSFLRKSVRRTDTFEESVLALESQGIEAVAAIPDMVAALHENELPRNVHRGFGSIVHNALVHIGPARLEDLPRLQPLLSIPHPITQELAAELIGRFGPEGKSAAAELEKTCLATVFEYQKLRQKASQIQAENERHEFIEMNSRYASAYEQLCSSFWSVTHDMQWTMKLMEEIVSVTEEPIPFYKPELEQATPVDAKLLLTWLDSENPHLAEIASDFGRKLPLSSLSIDQLGRLKAKEPFRWWTFEKLASASRDHELQAQLVDWMLEEFHAGRLSINDFARVVEKKRLRAPALLSILHSQFSYSNEFAKQSCLTTLTSLENSEPLRTNMVLNSVSESPELRQIALEIFLKHNEISNAQIQFATESLEYSDPRIIEYAITLLAKAGPAASTSLETIKRVRSPNRDEDTKDRINSLCLIALCSISNDKTEYQAELERLFHFPPDRNDYNPLLYIERLGPRSEFFLPEIERILALANTERERRFYYLSPALKALSFMENDRARALLDSLENDRDWLVQRYVKHLRQSRETGTEEYFNRDDY